MAPSFLLWAFGPWPAGPAAAAPAWVPSGVPSELPDLETQAPPVAPVAPGEYTYYCPRPAGYYPSVAACEFPWQAIPRTAAPGTVVSPRPPAGTVVYPTVTPTTPTVTPTPPGPTQPPPPASVTPRSIIPVPPAAPQPPAPPPAPPPG